MDFILKGFDQSQSVRRYTFEGISEDRSRINVVVSADLTLARTYAIELQGLPLLCRQLLDRCDATALISGSLTLTESDMAAVKRAAVSAQDEKKRIRPRPVNSAAAGNAWRGRFNAMPASKEP